MAERSCETTVQTESFDDLLKVIDLYWDEVDPWFKPESGLSIGNDIEYSTQTQLNEVQIQNHTVIHRSFLEGNYKIGRTKAQIIVAGEPPLTFPIGGFSIEVTPELTAKCVISVDDIEVPINSMAQAIPEIYNDLEQMKMEILQLLVDEGMDREADDPYIDKVKELAYKILGPDAETLWS